MESRSLQAKSYYAHSLSFTATTAWQTWNDHSEAVANAAKEYAGSFDSRELGEMAGWLHDLGKLHPLFQAYLLRENGLDASEWDATGNGRINHSGAGAVFASREWPRAWGLTLSCLVAGHHAGLPD